MSDTKFNAQDFLDQLLKAGQDLVEQGKSKGQILTDKSKELAAKGEDVLVDKLGIEDTDASRAALRKGVGAGAAAGALALLLSSRSGRKFAAIGGLAGLGALAYQAYKKNGGEMPKSAQDIIGLITGDKAEARADAILKAMIAAAKADGRINKDEMDMIEGLGTASPEALKAALAQPADPKDIAALADSEQAAREIYAASARIANGLNTKERDYLDALAMALKLDPELAARIETDVRTG
ncbi:MAG TPA: DUF533 domain-containing protein [Hellea balneolensis]|uniref:DUF533 domain-containing protein n=1 Tax=Hellea balneolensis TaxID=287478 RepID=A0A7C5LXK6_9PROT|nr:DUF533 domain-containing protein [Hellea balneolensis]